MSEYLLVPTNVQAFLVGKTADPNTDPLYDLAPVPRATDDIKNWYGDSKYSFSFQSSKLKSPLQSGIHLHWALPDALMHARHEGGKKLEQACIPNRWLVVRMWHAQGNSSISAKAWVVESDYVSDNDQSGGTPFFFSSSVKYVGRVVPPKGWQGTEDGWHETYSAYRFDLKSYGWGDPSFAAYYPACKGVLGFHDEMEGVNSGDLLTYLVIGWYSDPSRDPLYPPPNWQSNHAYVVGDMVTSTTPNGRQYHVTKAGTSGFLEPSWPDKGTVTNGTVDFAEHDVLASLHWSCSPLAGVAPPERTLCHGGIVGIKWQDSKQQYQPSPAGATTVAIGGSAAEALAALLDQKKDKSLQQVLCAFQYGQATQVSDYYQLGELLYRHSFSAVPGGTLWAIEPVARPAAAQSPLPPVSANVQKLLAELNQAQQALDQHAREIESLRSRLFACWATWASKQKGPPGGRPKWDGVPSAAEELKKATDAKGPLVEDCKKKVTDALMAEKTGMQLAESTMPPFLHPKDPFVVLKGENLVGIDRTRAQRPDKAPDGALRCRLAKDLVTGVSQGGTMSQEWSAEKCFHLDFPNAAGVPFGDVARTFALETLLFDSNCAALIDTSDAKVLDRELFKALQQSLDQSQQSNSNLNKLTWTGRPPDPLGVTRWGASNPWLPVYLMWQAHWMPAYSPVQGSDNSHSGSLTGWQFNSDALAGDLVPQQNSPVQPKRAEPLLEGATIISALSGSQLSENITKFAEATKLKADHLNEIRETLVLGQSLGGFNDLLVRQALGLCLPLPPPPVDPTNAKVDAATWEAMRQVAQPTMPVDRDYFFPVRAGAVKLVNLYVVDSFGQTRKLMDSERRITPNIIASAVLPPPPDKPAPPDNYHVSFSPRLVQPARLNFDWQPADDGASGPVCGWIVANFLEKSFAVFSASGEPLGALESMLPALGKKTIDSKVKFNWRPIPSSSLEISGIGNKRLQRFVELVTTFSADEGQAFLELVDLVLRKTEARLPPEDLALAVLLGRPLALVHASLGLEVQGLPAGYWKTEATWKFETEGFENLRVPVRLGGMNLPADGLVGYLLENGDCFFASEGATRRLGNNSHINYDQGLTVACTDKLSLTLLIDASARVHATTGILPRHFIQLPPEAGKQLSLIEEIYFSVAPVLGARPQESAAQPTMPRPSDAFGQWSWGTRPALGWNEIKPADDRARFADGLALSEGWLKLRLRRDQGDTRT